MEEQDSLEQYEKMHKVAQYTTIISTIASVIINVWVTLSLLTDVLGLNLGEMIDKIAKYGWRLPPDWVVQYQPYLYAMQWILLVTIVIDTGISIRYMRDGEPRVPLPYLRVVSFIGFFTGMWLYLAYKIAAYGLIFFASFVTMMYSLFVKTEEVEEGEESDFESEIWKEAASVFDPQQF